MKKNWTAYPYVIWMVIFTVIPMLLIVYFSITTTSKAGVSFTFDNFARLFTPIYLKVFWRSLVLAVVSTVMCLVIGYPLALIIARGDYKNRHIIIMLLVLPMWMNFLLRTYAWLTLLERRGLINNLLGLIGIQPISFLYNDYAVMLGMVYNFLPFMVLPIYSVLGKIDKSVIEAAQDLGANPIIVFLRVIFPLSIPGVFSGLTMVFMPALTTFVISRLLGGGQFTLLGNLIEQQYLNVGDWNFGSAISMLMIIIILLTMGFASRYEKDQEGMTLW